MNKQMPVGAVIQEFMNRADMKGNEVEAFAQAYNWVQSINEGELVVLPAEVVERYEQEKAEMLRLRDLLEQNGIDTGEDPSDEANAEETEEPPEE